MEKSGDLNMKLKPIGSRVLAKRKIVEAKTKGGILLPDESKEKSMEATVVAVGEGYELADGSKTIPLQVKVGDNILFAKNAGTEVSIDGEEYMVFEEREILGIKR